MEARAAFQLRVRELCEAQNLTLYALAQRSGVPRTTLLSAMDPSRGNPNLKTIAAVAAGFRMSLAEFFDSEEFDEYL